MGENIILALKVGVKPQKGREKPTKSRYKIVALLSKDGKLSAVP